MLFLNFSSVFAVLMMVEGLSATVNSFQCPDPVKAQAMCSRTDGDTTVVEKPYPDGLGYYCSSNIKDASQNCCNLDLKIGATYPGISRTVQTSSLWYYNAISETFSQWTQLLLPCGLAGPVKNCCNTDFKIRYLYPGNHTDVPLASYSGACAPA
ncbi:hypothetical protein H4Q26_000978 [Puccinia striiformis f. sp. tritici PST-130]|nr:hypothetical protein H4Q26_000978 [Puccinia striiformis f. sp. tritici PST-130]